MTYINRLVAYTREYLLEIKSNAPAIKGSVVTFTADLLETNGSMASVGDTLKWVRFNFFFSFYENSHFFKFSNEMIKMQKKITSKLVYAYFSHSKFILIFFLCV